MGKEGDEERKRRPHHRAVMLTIRRSEYEELKRGYSRVVSCCNDIIRTARCGEANEHHWERRAYTVLYAINGGHRVMNARWCGDCQPIKVEVVELMPFKSDDSAFRAKLRIVSDNK